MPSKARYWKNPEKHRAEYRNRLAHLKALGIKSAERLSPQAAERHKLAKILWGRAHRKKTSIASRKYRAKLRLLYGSAQPHAMWLHNMMRRTRDGAERKRLAATILPRKLVEGSQQTNLVSGRRRHRKRS